MEAPTLAKKEIKKNVKHLHVTNFLFLSSSK
jgi:hypothetical protein